MQKLVLITEASSAFVLWNIRWIPTPIWHTSSDEIKEKPDMVEIKDKNQ